MSTDPSNLNVQLINGVSNDVNADEGHYLMTAEAINGKLLSLMPAPTAIVEFDNTDLVDGIFTQAYVSNKPVIFWSLVDENDEVVFISPYMDPNGLYIEFDFSTIAPISGTWTLALWSEDGEGSPAPPTPVDTNDILRIRDVLPIDLKVIANSSIYAVPVESKLVLEGLDIFTDEADGVGSVPDMTLFVLSGATLMPIRTMVEFTQSDKRYSISLHDTDPIPGGAIVTLRVNAAGSASGNYTAKFVLSGYLI